MANGTHKLLVTLTMLFNIFSYAYFMAQWQYSTRTLRIANIMMYVPFLPQDCVTRLSAQDS
jgi:hypothetical protein